MGRFSAAICETERSPNVILESIDQLPVLQALSNERTESELDSRPRPKHLSRFYALDSLRSSIKAPVGRPNRRDNELRFDINEALSELSG